MTDQVLIERQNAWGIITLNRPEAINALSPAMMAALGEAFNDFQADPEIKAILFEGNGTRGFCAGGDVRAVREFVVTGNLAAADDFFVKEYRLNEAIARSVKPVVALTDGFTMGGGIGLAGHASHRITTEKSRFAMPENAIGLFCDVGVNAILRNRPHHQALAFLLSGAPVGAADAVVLGLTDYIVAQDSLAPIRAALIEQEGANIGDKVAELIAPYQMEPGATPFMEQAKAYKSIMQAPNVNEIVAGLKNLGITNGDAKDLHALLTSRCPTSLCATWHTHIAARTGIELSVIFQNDLAVARHMLRRQDFPNGVRAVLIEKTSAAEWQPASIATVDDKALLDLLSG